jgi:hypothetical protein
VRERLAQLVGEYRPARPAGPVTPDR